MVSPATATGTVTFYDGTTLLGTGTLNAGVATFSTSTLPAGQQSITASVTISSSPDPSTYRRPVTLTAQVTSPAVATGTLTFYRGSTSLGTATLRGNVATLNVASLPAGANSLSVGYCGDTNDQPSISKSHIQDVRDPTATVLTSSPDPSTHGQAVLLTATMTPAKTGGTVTFYQGATAIGTSTLSGGTATLSISTLSVGDHLLTASYNGNAGYSPSESPIVTQVVKQSFRRENHAHQVSRSRIPACTGYNSMPAMQADIKLAIVPAATARNPSLARSLFRFGARAPMPPICIAIELKLAKPQSA
jgi:Bacterial Ig-like domain (group 3)